MQAIDAYRSRFVGKMYPSRLRAILQGEDPDVYVKNVSGGLIALSDSTIIKCIKQYYVPPGELPRGKTNSPYLQCRKTRKCFGLLDSPYEDLACRNCHLECLEQEAQRLLTRKKRGR